MTLGGVAGLIAAIAFATLVIGLLMTLVKLPKLITELQDTIKRINTTIDVVTKDVDGLSIEVEALLNKTNTLMNDINGKIGKIDPLFTAVGDLGETVSEINESAKDTATNLISGIGKKRPSKAQRLLKTTSNLGKIKQYVTSKTKEDNSVEEVIIENPMSEIERELQALASRKPSVTAGEITINNK